MTVTLLKLAADFNVGLAAAVSVGQTTATLASATDEDGNALPAGKYGFTVDGATSAKEYIVCDLSGTALTNIQNVTRQGVASTGFANYHRVGATVTITDWAILSRMLNNLTGATGFDAGSQLTYDGQPANSDPLGIPTVQFVIDTASGGAVTFDAQVIEAIAGETIADGEWVYEDVTDGKWYKTDADDVTKCLGVKIGKARGAGTNPNPISGGVFVGGVEKVGTYVAGTAYYLSNTAGELSTSAGTNSVLVGYGDANGNLLLEADLSITPSQSDALTGSLGTPNSGNKYLTELNETTGGVDQSQTTQDATQEFGVADTTTLANKIAQSFIPTKTKMRGASLYRTTDTGSFTGTVTISLQADTAGSPSGVALATATITNAQWLLIPNGEFTVNFSTEYASLVLGDTYWLVLQTSTSDTSNHPNVRANSAGGYADGSVKLNNTTDGWVAVATIDLYFKTLEGNVSQVVETGTDGYVAPSLVPQLIGSQSASISIADGGAAAEVTLLRKTVRGGLLGLNNVLTGRTVFAPLGISSSAETLTLRLKYGGTTLASIVVPGNPAASVTSVLSYDLVAVNSAAAQKAAMQLIGSTTEVEIQTDAAVNITKIMGAGSGTATENSATDLDFVITAQYSGTNTANDLTALYSYVTILRQ